ISRSPMTLPPLPLLETTGSSTPPPLHCPIQERTMAELRPPLLRSGRLGSLQQICSCLVAGDACGDYNWRPGLELGGASPAHRRVLSQASDSSPIASGGGGSHFRRQPTRSCWAH